MMVWMSQHTWVMLPNFPTKTKWEFNACHMCAWLSHVPGEIQPLASFDHLGACCTGWIKTNFHLLNANYTHPIIETTIFSFFIESIECIYSNLYFQFASCLIRFLREGPTEFAPQCERLLRHTFANGTRGYPPSWLEFQVKRPFIGCCHVFFESSSESYKKNFAFIIFTKT